MSCWEMKLHALEEQLVSLIAENKPGGFSERDISIETGLLLPASTPPSPAAGQPPFRPVLLYFLMVFLIFSSLLDKVSFLKFSFESRTHYYVAKAGFKCAILWPQLHRGLGFIGVYYHT